MSDSGVYIYLQDPSLPFVKVGASSDIPARIKSFDMVCPRGGALATFDVALGRIFDAESMVMAALETAGFERVGGEMFRVPRRKRARAVRIAQEAIDGLPYECGICRAFGDGQPIPGRHLHEIDGT